MLEVTRTKKSKVALHIQEFLNELFNSDGHVLNCDHAKQMSNGHRGQVIRRINAITQNENIKKNKFFKKIVFQLHLHILIITKSVFNIDFNRTFKSLGIGLTYHF